MGIYIVRVGAAAALTAALTGVLRWQSRSLALGEGRLANNSARCHLGDIE
jgi:hypothetical protein